MTGERAVLEIDAVFGGVEIKIRATGALSCRAWNFRRIFRQHPSARPIHYADRQAADRQRLGAFGGVDVKN